MEMRKEIYDIDDVLGVDMNTNAVAVDIMCPVGSGLKDNCAAIIGMVIKRHEGKPEELGTFMVGALSPEAIVHYLIELTCDSVVGYLGAAAGAELMAVMNRFLRRAFVVALHDEMETRHMTMGHILDEVKEHLEEVLPLYQDGGGLR